MIVLTLLESEEQIISGIPEYIEFETDVPANIFYTLDGTDPTIESLIALGKVYLPTSGLTLTVKAIALSADGSSDVLEQVYNSDSTELDGPRNIGEGISVLPFGSTSVNNLSFDADGYAAQESSSDFVDLDIKASITGGENQTSVSFVNFADVDPEGDSFSSSSVNDNVYFDPTAKLILVDGSTDEAFDNQQVKLINRTYNSFDPTSKLFTERLGQKEPIVTGNYVRSYYNPATKEYVSFYYESVDSRWIISKQKLKNTVIKSGYPSNSRGRGGRFVYRWIENPGLSTPAASVGSILTVKNPVQSTAPQTLPDNWIIVTEYPEGTILYNGSEDFPEIEAGETYRFVYDESLESDDAIGFTYDGLTPYEDGITREGDPGDDGAYFEWEVDPSISVPPYGSELYVYIGGDPYIGEELTVTGSTFTSTPSEPTVDLVAEGDGQVSVSITPGDDGGSEITDYEYTTDGGGTWLSIGSTASPLVISPLVNGVEYDIQIRPVNDNGSGESSAVFSATPSTVPEQPAITSIVTGDQKLTVSVTGDNGGSAITDYEYSLNGGPFISAGTATSPFSITGLTNGTSYDVVVQAVNANGTGTPSAATTATPSTVPDAPTLNSLISGSTELEAAFTLGGTGGSAITDVEYRLNSGAWVSFGSTTSPQTITGLTNGVAYTVEVRAVNANGASAASNSLTETPAASWDPTDVSVVAWVDASDASSYTVSGSTLTAVTDKAGAYTLSVGGTPTRVLAGRNGLNTFDFDGSGEYLQSTTFSTQVSSGNHWAIGVFRPDVSDSTQDSLWSYETASSPKRDYAVSSGATGSWPGELDLDGLSSNRISSTIGNLQVWNLQSLGLGSWAIVVAYFNKTGNQIGSRKNGTNCFTPVNDYDNNLQASQELRLMRNRSSQELNGQMAEFFAVADLPGTGGTDISDIEKAEGYLAWKWGLEGQLPSGHPYKSSPP